ncbi:hypothetical protein [Streptomyces sp. MS2.AVA.5]|uniref:Uncharacterized protein n=1 Tax=Streptomyces achmelvichensis TaxID=3134111 RepID=A0ACC6PLD4_9ACTN
MAVLTPLSALAVWADRQIGDTGNYVTAVEPLAADPDVQNAVADRITTEVMKKIDAGPLQQGVENLVHEAVISFAGTDAYRIAWNTVNRATHTAVEQALTTDDVDTASIDLAPVIEQVKGQLSDEGVTFADHIPVGNTRITIPEPDKLGVARQVFDALQFWGLWLPVLAFAVAAVAVLASRRRMLSVSLLGLALAMGGALLRLTVARGRVLALAELPPDLDRPASGAVFDALTSVLRTTSWWLLGLGLLLTLATRILARHLPRNSPS